MIYLSISLSIIMITIIVLLNNIIIEKISLDKCNNDLVKCKNDKINIDLEMHEKQFFIMNSVCIVLLILIPFIKNKIYNTSFFVSFVSLMIINYYREWSNVNKAKLLYVLLFYLVIFILLTEFN